MLSPVAFDSVDLLNKKVSLFSSVDQIKEGPSIDEHKPVSRQYEADLNAYYGMVPYWTGSGIWGDGISPRQLVSVKSDQGNKLYQDHEADQHLRSVNEIAGASGYSLSAKDKLVGHVEDFIIDDETWAIHYLVIDTGNLFPGKKVTIAPDAITSIDWTTKNVVVDLHSDEIDRSLRDSVHTHDILYMEGVPINEIWKRKIG